MYRLTCCLLPNMFLITRTPVVILSAPRTGSCALGEFISNSFVPSIDYVYEPIRTNINSFEIGNLSRDKYFWYNENIVSFILHIRNNLPFVFKEHLINLPKYETDLAKYLSYDPAPFRIRLQRKDTVKQISSLFIARMRKKWFMSKGDLNIPYTVKMDETVLKECVSFIQDSNRVLANTDIKFDLDLWFEDLPELPNDIFMLETKPTNYDEVMEAVNKLIKE